MIGASPTIVKLPAALGLIALRHTIELMYGEAALKPESRDGHA